MAGEAVTRDPVADSQRGGGYRAPGDTVRRRTRGRRRRGARGRVRELSVRDVARRAEVGAATAYTYFASKDHLLVEVFGGGCGRCLQSMKPSQKPRPGSSPCSPSWPCLFPASPSWRRAHGRDVRHRSRCAATADQDRDGDPPAAGSSRRPANPATGLIELAYFGAMVQAGLGYTTYARMADRLAEAVELIMR